MVIKVLVEFEIDVPHTTDLELERAKQIINNINWQENQKSYPDDGHHSYNVFINNSRIMKIVEK